MQILMKKILLVSLFTTTLIASGALAGKSNQTTETKYTSNDGNKILMAQGSPIQGQGAQGGKEQSGQGTQGGQGQGNNKASDLTISSSNINLPALPAKDQAPADNTSNSNITVPSSSNSPVPGAAVVPAESGAPTTPNTPSAPALTGPAPLSVGPNIPAATPAVSEGPAGTPSTLPTPTDTTTVNPTTTIVNPTATTAPTDSTVATPAAVPETTPAAVIPETTPATVTTSAQTPVTDANANTLTVQPATVTFKGKNAAIYLSLTNSTSSPITLTDISAPGPEGKGCKTVLHRRAVDEEGTASMDEVGQLTINSGGTLDFAQEGLHVMLTRCAKTPKVGTTFNLMLTFDSGSTQNVPVDVISKISK